ncbi:MAG: nucleotidyltransferase family protein [Ferruginibacter sp.]
MINEAIILAGGLGTRLRAVVADLPKCMAPVNGIPFIHFIVAYLKKEGITKFIFALGYKNEVIIEYLDSRFGATDKRYIIETVPLGTGGAIKAAVKVARNENVIVLNGDTLFNVNVAGLAAVHETQNAVCTLSLKEMVRFSRYGSVELNPEGCIKTFHEKQYCERGLINGGVYALNVPSFLKELLPEVFSFENWLEKNTGVKKICGSIHQNYFIDIGIPADYDRFRADYNVILPGKKQDSDPENLVGSFFSGNLDLL